MNGASNGGTEWHFAQADQSKRVEEMGPDTTNCTAVSLLQVSGDGVQIIPIPFQPHLEQPSHFMVS